MKKTLLSYLTITLLAFGVSNVSADFFPGSEERNKQYFTDQTPIFIKNKSSTYVPYKGQNAKVDFQLGAIGGDPSYPRMTGTPEAASYSCWGYAVPGLDPVAIITVKLPSKYLSFMVNLRNLMQKEKVTVKANGADYTLDVIGGISDENIIVPKTNNSVINVKTYQIRGVENLKEIKSTQTDDKDDKPWWQWW